MNNLQTARRVENITTAQNYPASTTNEVPVKGFTAYTFTEEGEHFSSDPYLDYEAEELYKFLGVPATEKLSRMEKLKFEMEMAALNHSEITY